MGLYTARKKALNLLDLFQFDYYKTRACVYELINAEDNDKWQMIPCNQPIMYKNYWFDVLKEVDIIKSEIDKFNKFLKDEEKQMSKEEEEAKMRALQHSAIFK